jgi:hypothetical protein
MSRSKGGREVLGVLKYSAEDNVYGERRSEWEVLV